MKEALTGSERARIATCDVASGADDCARKILKEFASKAWRRPALDSEVTGLMKPVSLARSKGDSYEQGLELALQAVLVSPHFIFRVELDPEPTSTTPHALNAYEVASRLSYFLWSTMPDDALFSAAASGQLTDRALAKAQALRMLADPKAQALLDNFAGQWLFTRSIAEVHPDPTQFSQFDSALRQAMSKETELLFREIAFNGAPLDQLLTANYTFLNDRLAKHYGLPSVGSETPQRVTLSTDQRGGLLSHAGLLTVTSHPNVTSPVLRGKWVLSQMLCQDVPPPPPGTNTELNRPSITPGSTRQRNEQHSADPCASCHLLMDPIGYGLENYDAIGAYRSAEGTYPIDSSGTLNGQSFSGARSLSALIAADPAFSRCAAEQLYTYALGRAPERTEHHMDPAVLVSLDTSLRSNGMRFADLVAAIVTSDPFLSRRGEAAVQGGVGP